MTDTAKTDTPDAAAAASAAALAVVQSEVTKRDEQIAAQADQLKLAEESLAAARRETAAAKALAAALEAKRAAAEERAEAASKDANFSSASSKARHLIVIDEAIDKAQRGPVDVGCNGRVYRIQRGVPVEVPMDVINVLNDAVIGRAEPQIDEKTGIHAGVQFTDGRRFPFQHLRQTVNDAGERLAA